VSVTRFMHWMFPRRPGGQTEAVDYEQKKLDVWCKGHIIPGYDPMVWRHDDFGRTIRYICYGDRSQYGWAVFPIHSIPLFSLKSTWDLPISDLRPLRWSSSPQRSIMDRYPSS
jgi:hypothetical protein